jgi:hypothetical protein
LAWKQGKLNNRFKATPWDAFFKHVERLDTKLMPKGNDCWKWTGKIGKKTGYGIHTTCNNNKMKWYLAHRYSFELIRCRNVHKFNIYYDYEKIPDGLTLDHLCRNRWCVNPYHLEPVTLRENILRGNGITAKKARQTLCIRNHPLFGENLYITPNGRRQCRICRSNCAKKHKEVSHPTFT